VICYINEQNNLDLQLDKDLEYHRHSKNIHVSD